MIRYFVLTSGEQPHDAIDAVERRGYLVIATALTFASSVAVYGICEITEPKQAEPEDRR